MKKWKQKLAYALGGDIDDPKKRPTAKEIKEKYKTNPYVTNGREIWAEYLDKELPLSKKKVKEVLYSAARTTGVDPSLLYTSAMEEGMGYALSKPDDVSKSYGSWADVNPKAAAQFPVDGFYNYGLDTFGSEYENLKKKGYLPEGFDKRFTVFEALNESKQAVKSAAFASDEDALVAKAAMMRAAGDSLDQYTAKNNLTLSPKARDFFTIASYNAGSAKVKEMLKSYNDAGYLKNDDFLKTDFKPASWNPVYKNVQRRLQNREILNSEGFFEDYSTNNTTDMAKTTTRRYATGGATSSGFDWMNIAKMVPQLSDSLISLFENNPSAQTREPLINASTMRSMVSPYSKFATGGSIDNLSGDELAQLQAMAEEQGMTIEELIQHLQSMEIQEGDSQAELAEELEEGDDLTNPYLEDTEEFAYGGSKKPKKKKLYATGGDNAIEVEGGEVLETPDGAVKKVKGKKHESGGVDVVVPDGTKIYSDRLKIGGKTMKERKLDREKRLEKLTRLIDKNPQDKLLKQTLSRTMEVTSAEENADMMIQNMAKALYDSRGQFATGGYAGGDPRDPYFDKTGWNFPNWEDYMYQLALESPVTPLTRPTTQVNAPVLFEAPGKFPGIAPIQDTEEAGPQMGTNLGVGDYVGMFGNLFNAVAPIVNTQNNAANRKPNVNRFLGFGKDAIDTNLVAQNIAAGQRTSTLTDIETSANSARLRNRNSARGVNTLRALDALTDVNTNEARGKANIGYGNQMIGLLGQKSNLENLQDKMEMSGQAAMDMEDKADIDNYYTNMAENLVNFGNNVQGVGRSLNINKSNRIDANLISQLSQYGLGFDEEGNLITVR